jgi:hypothetical protein
LRVLGGYGNEAGNMKKLLALLVMAGLFSGAAVAGEKHWEKAKILSHTLQRMVGPHGGRPETLDVLIIDLGDQTYTLGRVSGWSGNHTKMADLPTQYVQVYRPWGAVPLARATRDPNLLAPMVLGLPGLLFATRTYFIKVLDNRGKHVAYEVMGTGEPEKPKGEAPLPPGVTAKASEPPTVPADSALGSSASSVNALSGETQTVNSQSQNVAALLGLEVTTWEQGGTEIVKIAPDSEADRAGLHVGNVINSVDGKQVRSATDLAAALVNRPPGSKIRVGYMFRSNLGWMPGAEKVLTLPN